MVSKRFVLFLSCIFLLSLVSASFEVGNPSHSIKPNYNASDYVNGWVNVSFENEWGNSTVKDSWGNEISVLEFVEKNVNVGNIEYEKTNFTTTNSTGGEEIFYLINMGFEKLYLTGFEFSVIETSGEVNYTFGIGEEEIFNQKVNVSSAPASLKSSLVKKRNYLNQTKYDISIFDDFIRDSLEKALNISHLESELNRIGNESYGGVSDDKSKELSENLSSLKIPISIFESVSASSISFAPSDDVVFISDLVDIGGGNYEENSEDDYIEAVKYWNFENNVRVSYSEISGNGLDQSEIITYFKFSFSQKGSGDLFMIIYNPENLNFKSDYGEVVGEDYTYINLKETGNTIEFTTTEKVDFEEIPVFVSPPISELSLEGAAGDYIDSETERKISKWTLFSLIMVLIFILAAVIYVVMKNWYDKKYENYLFKNRNDLYNLIVYINNAKKKGVSVADMEKNLRKAKWSSEQIRYVIRKYAGKNTGVWSPSFMKKQRK